MMAPEPQEVSPPRGALGRRGARGAGGGKHKSKYFIALYFYYIRAQQSQRAFVSHSISRRVQWRNQMVILNFKEPLNKLFEAT